MRTTLSLDDDVAAQIERLRAERGGGLKELINQALRAGLRDLEPKPKPSPRYRTPSVDLGRCHLTSLDDVAAALAVGEGQGFR
jgi:Ribbon-helix-helix protein, copG family